MTTCETFENYIHHFIHSNGDNDYGNSNIHIYNLPVNFNLEVDVNTKSGSKGVIPVCMFKRIFSYMNSDSAYRTINGNSVHTESLTERFIKPLELTTLRGNCEVPTPQRVIYNMMLQQEVLHRIYCKKLDEAYYAGNGVLATESGIPIAVLCYDYEVERYPIIKGIRLCMSDTNTNMTEYILKHSYDLFKVKVLPNSYYIRGGFFLNVGIDSSVHALDSIHLRKYGFPESNYHKESLRIDSMMNKLSLKFNQWVEVLDKSVHDFLD